MKKYMKCSECGESGHIRCTSFRKSRKVKLNFSMECGCAGCGSSNHDVSECYEKRGNYKYVQFENVRAKF